MNYLGRGWTSCVAGLRNYRKSVRRVRQVAKSEVDTWRAREHLEHLLFELEVDVAARAGPQGGERMMEVELRVFYPTLLRLQHALSGISVTSDPVTWESRLSSALAILRDAGRRLRDLEGERHAPTATDSSGAS